MSYQKGKKTLYSYIYMFDYRFISYQDPLFCYCHYWIRTLKSQTRLTCADSTQWEDYSFNSKKAVGLLLNLLPMKGINVTLNVVKYWFRCSTHV
ncbi:hypothetical protein GDO81_018215 [Engystomops pustulosus]|uniref:Uncharacterized protein n=1 Tax=Engystomops pustulosus TaxID=76066 RepID=A0AAV7A9M6_ENGPU|nr:hypothetical protein GDO81_018215 [Engystomops pustulosus]